MSNFDIIALIVGTVVIALYIIAMRQGHSKKRK